MKNKTLENLEVGDILVDRDGYERMVLGVCGRVLFLSITFHFDESGSSFTIQELEKGGYTLKGQEPKSDREKVAELIFGWQYSSDCSYIITDLADRILEVIKK